jgi:uncharacterized membrane protein (DUF485 family)
MTQPHGTVAERADGPVEGGADGSDHHPEIDWKAAARSPEFQELVTRKRRFVVPATVFFLAWYFGFVILAGYAPDFMGETFITDGLTVGYVLALSQFVMVWGLAVWYLRKSDRVFDPLAERAAARALETSRAGATPDNGRPGRFERDGAAAFGTASDEEVTLR